jgi:hypothetical protein
MKKRIMRRIMINNKKTYKLNTRYNTTTLYKIGTKIHVNV